MDWLGPEPYEDWILATDELDPPPGLSRARTDVELTRSESRKTADSCPQSCSDDSFSGSEPSTPSSGWEPWLKERGWDGLSCSSDRSYDPGILFIFDWDDTLCPTTAMEGLGDTEPSPEIVEHLGELARHVWFCLSKAIDLGARVIIVTNATEGWVQASCERWFPALVPLISSLEVISARSTWEPHGVSSPTGWKARTFESLAFCDDEDISPDTASVADDRPVELWKDLIIVGDASFEHDALLRISSLAPSDNGYKHLETCRCKSVRFRIKPSIALLCAQLSTLNKQMEAVIACERSNEFRLVP
mmetsp:Transcript_43680/g.79702  ORF Transcript_43680/g.79702 Transcript_43680/m.79702 type:complete len:304 (-) Transcript_43680:51-962(-)